VLFNSFDFLFLFLPLLLAAFALLDRGAHHAGKIPLLLAASLLFYGCWDWRYLFLLGASIGFNYAWALLLQRQRGAPRRGVLAAGVAVNLAALAFFKYAAFLFDNLARILPLDSERPSIVLPIGISFFTLQQIAFLVDVRNGQTAVPPFSVYALFVSFFPQLVAGPIVRARELLPQLAAPMRLRADAERLVSGFFAIAVGLFKKVVLADMLGRLADPVFNFHFHPAFLDAWGAALAFTLQIYFDFSAYADIAIGLGRLVGVELPENFDSPYQARNISEFWRRWHITLSTFLRDYVFIPLARRQAGALHIAVSLVATFLLAGIWHGAAWTFVAWGLLNAVYMLVAQRWRRPLPLRLAQGVTFAAVVAGMVLFRAADFARALDVLLGMAGAHGFAWSADVGALGRQVFLRILPLLALVLLAPNRRQLEQRPWTSDGWAALVFALLFGIAVIEIGTPQPFVYFQF
jgi:D-alanyl-lipoteichoic acid acyltransferase DltB (MBOAT superfamily)